MMTKINKLQNYYYTSYYVLGPDAEITASADPPLQGSQAGIQDLTDRAGREGENLKVVLKSCTDGDGFLLLLPTL